jgi:hypothetical protein
MKRDGGARGQLPPDAYTELRESIKAIELEAERLQQLALELMTEPPTPKPTVENEAGSCASVNLELYLSEAGLTPDADMRMHLAKIINASTDIGPAQDAAQLAAVSRSGERSTDG